MIPSYDFNPFMRTADIDEFGRILESASPDAFHIGSLGHSREGRDITLWTLGDASSGDVSDRPAIYVQGMVHSHELSGLTACCYLAHRFLQEHEQNGLLHRLTVYVVPRINPDGAEYIQGHTGCIRSRLDPAADRSRPNTWVDSDVDGDGHILELRYEDPCGNWALSPEDPRRLVRRVSESKGPFYTIRMEGAFQQFDGSPVMRNGNQSIDFNRNYSGSWQASQPCAGPYPHSEPETRAVADFFAFHSEIFAAIDFHNGPLQVLAPPAVDFLHLNPEDAPLFDKIGELARECNLHMSTSCRYPADGRIHNAPGNFVDWAYFIQGIPGFVIELGTCADSAVSPEDVMKYDCQPYIYPQVDDWQKTAGDGIRRFYSWRTFNHPQLGKVEIGGKEPRAYSLPGIKDVREFHQRAFCFCLALGSLAPHLEILPPEITRIDTKTFRVRARLFNNGALPMNITRLATTLAARTRPYAELIPADGVHCHSANRGQDMDFLPALGSTVLEWFVTAEKAAPGTPLGILRCTAPQAGNCQLNIFF